MPNYEVDFNYTDEEAELLDYPQIKLKKKQKFDDDDMVHHVKNNKSKNKFRNKNKN
jgi:hypothetical protein